MNSRLPLNPYLCLIIGPMFSSKTTTLISKIQREEIAKRKCLIIKWVGDTRYTNESKIVTHHGIYMSADISCDRLLPLLSNNTIDSYDVIAIDEGQFFPDLYEFVIKVLNVKNKKVLISALNGDYRMQNFGEVYRLIPVAEEIIKLNAVCMVCHEDAQFTCRQDKSNEQQIIVGGEEMYLAVCRKCWNGFNNPAD